MTEITHITGHDGGVILERGTVRGTPIGSGTVTMQAHLAASGALVYFTVAGPHGTVMGVARVRLTFGQGVIRYSGTASLTRGTGGYRGVKASHLKVSGQGDIAGTRTVLRVTGEEYL